MRRRGRVLAGLVALTALLVGASAPAGATTGDDVTGDITDPVLASMSLDRPTIDVTDADASVTVTLRATDDRSGLREVWLAYTRPNPDDGNFGINVVRVSGDDLDGTYQATIPIRRGSPAGEYRFNGDVADRVGNVDAFQSSDLGARGFPSGFTVVDRAPDTTPPTVGGFRLSTASVDVRGGAQ